MLSIGGFYIQEFNTVWALKYSILFLKKITI